MHKLYRWFKRRVELRRIERYYTMCTLFWHRGKMTDRELGLHAEWVLEQKEKLK